MQNSFLEHEVEKWRFLIFCTVAGFTAFSTNRVNRPQFTRHL